MYQRKFQIGDVIYNAASGEFEALVTIRETAGVSRYACTLHAPIQTSFEDAADGLVRQARAQHSEKTGLWSLFSPKRKRRTERAFAPYFGFQPLHSRNLSA